MKRALITGASSNLGQAIARALAADGWALRLTGRDAPVLDALAAELAGADAMAGNLSDGNFRSALLANHPVTGLVHAASHRFRYQRFHAVDPADAAAQRALDHDAPLDLLQRALPEMMALRSGRVVIISSLAASLAGQGATLYAAYKAGLEGLVRGLALEYGRFGVTVNAVAPGFIDTRRLAERSDAAARLELARRTALKRIAAPAEIAAAVAFLMSPAASYITGISLPVTGGAHLNCLW